jgi:putative Mg2+ transporter-C (MgtC) family protein
MDPVSTAPDAVVMATRLGLALVAGALIGLDRELKRKPAGLRTHAMVSIGSALVVLVVLAFGGGPGGDPLSRTIQGIITGIGFLGAGVIMQYEHERRVEGLTTAASIWVAAGLGMACGAGLIELTAIALGATLLVLVGGEFVERALGDPNQKGGEADARDARPPDPQDRSDPQSMKPRRDRDR